MSVMPIRPPGRRTRAISRKTAGLSAARFTTQLLMTTSIESAGRGIASIWPLRNSTLVAPASAALRCARASISSVMSSPKPGRSARRVWQRAGRRCRPRAQVEDPLPFSQVRDSGRIAAAQRRQDRCLGQLVALEHAVQTGADALLGSAARAGAATPRALLRPRIARGPCRESDPSLQVPPLGQPTWTRPARLAPMPPKRRGEIRRQRVDDVRALPLACPGRRPRAGP